MSRSEGESSSQPARALRRIQGLAAARATTASRPLLVAELGEELLGAPLRLVRLAAERGGADLSRGPRGAQHGHEVLGIAHALGGVLLDVADGARAREVRHADLARGEGGLRVEVLLARPALGLELVQLLQIVEGL